MKNVISIWFEGVSLFVALRNECIIAHDTRVDSFYQPHAIIRVIFR